MDNSKNQKHPCFSASAAQHYARIHLPVAMHCNINCNYCNRRYDCLNESRPGVTSAIISPAEALRRYQYHKQRLSNLSVVGIAGPGDALADWEETSQTIRLIRKYDPEVILCLSTNGLKLPSMADDIVKLGVSHVTVTVNALNPETGAKIYRYVNYQGKRYTGNSGADLLLYNQLEGIRLLVSSGIMVKVNTVMIPGINDHEIRAVVQKMSELGVYITNIMPFIPVRGSVFEKLSPTDRHKLDTIRSTCQTEMLQLLHCRQCRADAVGMLTEPKCNIQTDSKAV
ncbi:Nitrogenase cofactor biosynthesis protein NifB [Syntrophomonas zehnderi OL-4]|uniref:FeMo cofactor biosynthesis protein NifB n=2 Tax=Syntrophomonas TaxID=862 RepID=A0A0E4C8V8_9FIRM|nr:Nitrogenase cofactor biosynthesis protein NifB [Syntrophomonas zehnderi OL-4]